MRTDGRVAVLRMNDCRNPRTIAIDSTKTGSRGRRAVQTLIALRNDLVRINPVSLAYSTITALKHHQSSTVNGSMSAFGSKGQKTDSSKSSAQPAWIRPSVLDASITTADSQR
jgi:hypothetical protein